MKQILFTLSFAALAACGGGAPDVQRAPLVKIADGPINRACMASDRKNRSVPLCGCIQAVADTEFSNREQRRIAGFFGDPHETQEIRQSDNASNEDFWLRYKSFGNRVERQCRAV